MDVSPNPIDQYVGRRIREKRESLLITQLALARETRNSVEQIALYESGLVRVGAEQLQKIAQLFNISAMYFFEGWQVNKPTERRGRPAPKLVLVEPSDNVVNLRTPNNLSYDSHLHDPPKLSASDYCNK